MRWSAAGASLCVLLAGCGGSGGPNLTAPIPAGPSPAGTATVTIAIGGKSASSAARRPAYISPSMQYVSLSVNGGAPLTVSCTASCTLTVGVPYGQNTFTVNTYDAVPKRGNLLSTATVTANITSANGNIDVPTGAVADPAHSTATIVASDADVLSGTVANGTAQLGGTLEDADGNVIPSGALLAPVAFDNGGSTTVSVPSTPVTYATGSLAYTYTASGNGTLRAVVQATGGVLATASLLPAPYFAFVGDSTDGQLEIVSPTRHAVVGSLSIPGGGQDLAVDSAAATAYVLDQGNASVAVVDVIHKNAPKLKSSIAGFAGTTLVGVDIDRVHGTLYVGTLDPSAAASGLWSVPLAGGTPARLLTTSFYGAPVVDSTGTCVYGPVYGRNFIGYGDSTGFDVYNVATKTDLGFHSATFTGYLIVAPDAKMVYTLDVPGSVVEIFSVGAGCSVTNNGTIAQNTNGANPKALAINRAGTKMYVGSAGGNPNLAVYGVAADVPSGEVDDSVGSGFGLYNTAVAPDGLIYTADFYIGANLHVIDPTGASPVEVPWSPLAIDATQVRIAP